MIRHLLVAALAAAVSALPGAAQAQDTRPCVSKREFRGMDIGASKGTLERAWEVVGAGTPVPEAIPGAVERPLPTFSYRACGYSEAEADVVVVYNFRRRSVVAFRFADPTAVAHGHI